MARSKCLRCESGNFEVVRVNPAGLNTTIQVVQCARCGTAFGSLDDNLQEFIEQHTKQLKFDIRCIELKIERLAAEFTRVTSINTTAVKQIGTVQKRRRQHA